MNKNKCLEEATVEVTTEVEVDQIIQEAEEEETIKDLLLEEEVTETNLQEKTLEADHHLKEMASDLQDKNFTILMTIKFMLLDFLEKPLNMI